MNIVMLAGQLTVFRNVEHFRKYFAASFKTHNGDIQVLAHKFQQPGHK